MQSVGTASVSRHYSKNVCMMSSYFIDQDTQHFINREFDSKGLHIHIHLRN